LFRTPPVTSLSLIIILLTLLWLSLRQPLLQLLDSRQRKRSQIRRRILLIVAILVVLLIGTISMFVVLLLTIGFILTWLF
jgi:hypothetical protein